MMRKAPRLTRRNSNSGSTFADGGAGTVSSSLSTGTKTTSGINGSRWYQHSAAALEASFQSHHANSTHTNKKRQGWFPCSSTSSTNRRSSSYPLSIFFVTATCLIVVTYVSMFRRIMKNVENTSSGISGTADSSPLTKKLYDPQLLRHLSHGRNAGVDGSSRLVGRRVEEERPQVDYLNNETSTITTTKTLSEDLRLGSGLDLDNTADSILELTPLRPIDYQHYTVRINTFRRNEQLLVSVNHWSTCEGVKQIQVIWCDTENEPPPEIVEHTSGKVIVEKHSINSLNERFHIMDPEELPTYGILSVDDDVLRPCQAVDSGFFRWTRQPHRIVGYDTRVHTIEEIPSILLDTDTTQTNEADEGSREELKEGTMTGATTLTNPTTTTTTTTWGYGALSVSQKTHMYSMVLTRFCFIHKDYLDLYYNTLPSDIILDPITEYLNCEDIAMTLLVSSRTKGKPPLLANAWARKTQIKLYQSNPISGGEDNIEKQEEHRRIRNQCMDTFATYFHLKPAQAVSLQVDKSNDKLNNKDTILQLKNGTKLLASPSQQEKNKSRRTYSSLISYNYVDWDKNMKPYFGDEFVFLQDQDNNLKDGGISSSSNIEDVPCPRETNLVKEWNFHYQHKNTSSLIKSWIDVARQEALSRGLIQKTKEWNQRFGSGATNISS